MIEHLVILLLYVGLLAFFAWRGYRRVQDNSDYILGGRRMGWFIVALSAGATGMSGWLMLGLPGEAYRVGASVLWLVLGLATGAFASWLIVARRLRIQSEQLDSLTLPGFFAARVSGEQVGQPFNMPVLIRRVSGFSILIFLGLYTATGLVAGGKLFEQVFELDYRLGVLVTVLLILPYSLLGGFLSISWSDVIQAVLMIFILLVTAFLVTGGNATLTSNPPPLPEGFYSPLSSPAGGVIGMVAVISGLSWGFGYFGQPHLLARYKAMGSPKHWRRAMPMHLFWMLICMLAAVSIGLSAREYMVLADPETAILSFVGLLYSPLIGGIALTAVLAAIMSTADSQLLVATAAFSDDLIGVQKEHRLRINRIVMGVIAGVATLVALRPESNVFNLVSYAWAGLGASFGPSVILSLYWKKLTSAGILLSILTGTVTVFVWDYLPSSLNQLYVLGPAFVFSLLVAVVASLIQTKWQEGLEKTG